MLITLLSACISLWAEDKTYNINNIFEFSLSTKMELRDKNSAYSQKNKYDLITNTSPDAVVFQQAGLDTEKNTAYQTYARVMIYTQDGLEEMGYADEEIELSDADVDEFNRLAFQELGEYQMIVEPTTNAFNANGQHYVRTFYRRTGGYGGTDVFIYYFFTLVSR